MSRQQEQYLHATHNVLRATSAQSRNAWGKLQQLPGGVPHWFVGKSVIGPQCCTVTVQIRNEDLKTVLGLGKRLALQSGSQFARVYQDRYVVRIEFTLPPEQWREVRLDNLPHHTGLASFGQKALGQVARMSFDEADDISPHKFVCGTSRSGKTVVISDVLISLLKTNPSTDLLKFIIINPKNDPRLRKFSRVPYLMAAQAIDTEDCANLLRLALGEMINRQEDDSRCKQRIVLVIDEVADLVQSNNAIAPMITKLSQKAGGLGINIITATQAPNPSVFGPKGSLAKANLGSRLVFQLQNESAYLATGLNGIKTAELGYGGKGDGLAISNGIAHRFRAALPNETDYAKLPQTEMSPGPPSPDLLAGDAAIDDGMAWYRDDLADRLAFAAEVKDSATAIMKQFGGSAARAAWVRELWRDFEERRGYWRKEGIGSRE